MTDTWRNCNFCKKPIKLGQVYWKCSVSTCNRKGTSYVFCSVQCWDGHVPVYNHRNAWAEEERAPTSLEPPPTAKPQSPKSKQERNPQGQRSSSIETEILVVGSKLKAYVRDQSGLNTSASALEALSRHIRTFCDQAIDRAEDAGRKTVMDRDIL